jgi:hypothetical protein
MPLFNNLIRNSSSASSLQVFVLNNIQHFHNLYNSHFEIIQEEKSDIRDFIELKGALIEDLDYSLSQCKAFISILFEFCERFGFLSTVRIENTLLRRELYLGKRREAAKLFLLNIRNNYDYIERFEPICTLLQCSIETEEDSDVKPNITFANFYAKVLRDTSDKYVFEFRSKFQQHLELGSFSFLQNEFIQSLILVSTEDLDSAHTLVQNLIESYLGHITEVGQDVIEQDEDVLIENDTEYSRRLIGSPVTFSLIRNIALEKCREIPNSLPGRGVVPLTSESQMYVYLKRYGNMHRSKLLTAFETLPFNLIHGEVEVIDWGCGQGLASIVLIDFLSENRLTFNIKKIILIEPSELCLKRAALHVNLANESIPIKTTCNVFNNLALQDITTSSERIKLHLFSNILDLDESIFNQSNLIRLIEETQSGINYFICVSPYITDEKADRVNSFKRHFEIHYESFVNIFEVSNSGRLNDEYWNCNNHYNNQMNIYCQHPECGCEKKWTRVMNVFKVEIN